MTPINLLAVLVAAVGALVLSSVYYIALAKTRQRLQPDLPKRPGWSTPVLEIIKNIVLGSVMAWLIATLDLALLGSLLLALALFIAFPLLLMVSSWFHDGVKPAAVAIHAGDWAIKLAFFAILFSLWR